MRTWPGEDVPFQKEKRRGAKKGKKEKRVFENVFLIVPGGGELLGGREACFPRGLQDLLFSCLRLVVIDEAALADGVHPGPFDPGELHDPAAYGGGAAGAAHARGEKDKTLHFLFFRREAGLPHGLEDSFFGAGVFIAAHAGGFRFGVEIYLQDAREFFQFASDGRRAVLAAHVLDLEVYFFHFASCRSFSFSKN